RGGESGEARRRSPRDARGRHRARLRGRRGRPPRQRGEDGDCRARRPRRGDRRSRGRRAPAVAVPGRRHDRGAPAHCRRGDSGGAVPALIGNGASRPAPGATYALIVLFAINLMNFFDRQLIGGIGEGIRREWGLSDTALGLLGTVFTLLYAIFGLPLGRLSDTK